MIVSPSLPWTIRLIRSLRRILRPDGSCCIYGECEYISMDWQKIFELTVVESCRGGWESGRVSRWWIVLNMGME